MTTSIMFPAPAWTQATLHWTFVALQVHISDFPVGSLSWSLAKDSESQTESIVSLPHPNPIPSIPPNLNHSRQTGEERATASSRRWLHLRAPSTSFQTPGPPLPRSCTYKPHGPAPKNQTSHRIQELCCLFNNGHIIIFHQAAFGLSPSFPITVNVTFHIRAAVMSMEFNKGCFYLPFTKDHLPLFPHLLPEESSPSMGHWLLHSLSD